MAESGSTIPLVNVTTSGGYGAATVTVLSASSGLVQVSGVPSVIVSSSGGLATIAAISASSGAVQISGVPAVVISSSGGLATLSVVSASSGLIQVSTGTIPTVSVTTSGGVWSGVPPVTVTTSGGYGAAIPTVQVTTSGGVWATVPGINVTTSGGWGSAQSVTSTGVRLVENAGIAPKFTLATSVSKVSSSAGNLWALYAFTTGISGAVLRLYNATTGNVVMNTGIVAYVDVDYQSTAISSVPTYQSYGPWGMNFGTACSYDVVLTATSTLAVSGRAFVTSLFR